MGLQTGADVAYNPNYIVSMAVDAQGVVWAGTWGGGLSRFDGKTWTHYTVAEGLPGNHVFMLHIDPKGQLWIGTNDGLARGRPAAGFEVMTTATTACSTTPSSRWPRRVTARCGWAASAAWRASSPVENGRAQGNGARLACQFALGVSSRMPLVRRNEGVWRHLHAPAHSLPAALAGTASH
jgi:hypothetical protein